MDNEIARRQGRFSEEMVNILLEDNPLPTTA